MYSVYTVTDTPNKPMTFSLVKNNLSRSEANALASTMRRNTSGGMSIAVCVGNRVKSLHNRP